MPIATTKIKEICKTGQILDKWSGRDWGSGKFVPVSKLFKVSKTYTQTHRHTKILRLADLELMSVAICSPFVIIFNP